MPIVVFFPLWFEKIMCFKKKSRPIVRKIATAKWEKHDDGRVKLHTIFWRFSDRKVLITPHYDVILVQFYNRPQSKYPVLH